MEAQTSEASAKAGPGVLLPGEHRNPTEFEAQAQVIAARFGVSNERARLTVYLLRGGVE